MQSIGAADLRVECEGLVKAVSSTCANGTQLTFKTRTKMQLTTSGMIQQQDLMEINPYNSDGW